MLVVLTALALGNNLCDNVVNWKPVAACNEYTALTNKDECTFPDLTATNFSFRQINDFNLCAAKCNSSKLDECFSFMSNFINKLTDTNDYFTMGYIAEDNSKYEFAIMKQSTSLCTKETFTESDLKAACNSGWRTHHGIEPNLLRRSTDVTRYNNKFEVGSPDDSDDDSDVLLYVGISIGAVVFLSILYLLYNNYKKKGASGNQVTLNTILS